MSVMCRDHLIVRETPGVDGTDSCVLLSGSVNITIFVFLG